MIIIVDKNDAEKALSILGSDSQTIGSVKNGKGVLHTAIE